MKIRIVISQPLYRRVESFCKPLDPRRRILVRRQFRKCRVQPLHSFEKGRQSLLIEHHQSPAASHFPTATPYPIAPPSLAIPAAPAVSESLHPDTPSTFHSPPAALFRPPGDSTSLRQIAIETPPRFVVRVAIPAVPPPSPHPARALAESFALHPRSIRFSCSSG